MALLLSVIVGILYLSLPFFGIRHFILLIFFLYNFLNPLIHFYNSLNLDAIIYRNAKALIHTWLFRGVSSGGVNQIKIFLWIDLSVIDVGVSLNCNLCLLDYFIDLYTVSFVHPNRWESETDKNYTCDEFSKGALFLVRRRGRPTGADLLGERLILDRTDSK